MASRRPLRDVAVFAHLADSQEHEHRFVPAGRLSRAAGAGAEPDAVSFAYGLRYLDRPDAFEVEPRALGLRDRQAARGVDLYPLAGLTEFGGIRDAAPDAWGRRVIEARLRVPANSLDEFTYLLEAGSDRVGALDVRERIDAEPIHAAGGLASLPYLLQAAAAVEAGEPIPAHLMPYLGGAPSAGGARPKASVRDDSQVLWLAKFPARRDPFDMALTEAATLALARRAGMTVPPARLHPIMGQSLLLIRRFDRYWAEPGQRPAAGTSAVDTHPQPGFTEGRLPQISGLTLVGCNEMDSNAKSYVDLATAIRAYCHPPFVAPDCAQLFARMVFNIFVTNDDDHLRNHAFVHDAAAGGWRLSPLYDVVPRPSLAYERFLHLGIGEQGRLASLDNAMSRHSAFIPNRPDAIEAIRRIWGEVRQWRTCFEEIGASAPLLETLAPAFRQLEDIASPGLAREIRRGA